MELQNSLSQAKFDLAKLQAGISNTNEYALSEIKRLNKNIKGWQADIDKLNAEIEVLKSADYEAAQAALPKLQAKKVALTTDKRNAMLDLKPKADALQAASAAVEDSEYLAAISGLKSASYPTGVQFGLVEYDRMGSYVPQAADGKYCAYYSEMDESGNNTVWTFIPVFTDGSENSTNAQYWYNDNQVNFSYNVYSNPYYALVEGGADKLNALVADNVKDLTSKATKADITLTDKTKLQSDLVAAQKAYEKAKKANTGLVTNDPNAPALQAAQKDAAKKLLAAINAVTGANTKFEDVTYAGYFDDKVAYNAALQQIDREVSNATTAKNRADNSLANAKKNAEEIKGYLATLTSDATDFSASLKACNDAQVAFEEAYDKYYEIANELSVVEGQIYAYNQIIDANGDSQSIGNITNSIQQKENNIKRTQGYIDDALAQIADWEESIETGNMTDEVTIEKTKTKIATLEAEIEAQEEVVKAAKAALDAALTAE